MKKLLTSAVVGMILMLILSGCSIQSLKLIATPLSQTSIKLKWNGSGGDFVLYRSLTRTGIFAKIGEATSTSYIDRGLSVNTTYYYEIKEKSKSNFSKLSNIASATTFEQIPKAPVLSVAHSSTKAVTLSWIESSETNLKGFILCKAQGAKANFTQIATLSSDKMNYTDNKLNPNTEYAYKVRAYNNGGNSKWSNIVNIKTPYVVSGYVMGSYGRGVPDVIVSFGSKYKSVKSNLNGYWIKKRLRGNIIIKPSKSNWSFIPMSVKISGESTTIDFFGVNMSKKEGTLRWKFETQGGVSNAVIGLKGTVYVESQDDYLYAINPNGTLKWKFKTWNWVDFNPVVSSNGTVYAVSHHGYLCAINPNGTLKWKFETGSKIESSPAIGSDGTIYIGSDDDYLYAINPNGALKWRFKSGWDVMSSPAIGSDGTIYIGSDDGYLYAVNLSGKLKWKFECGYFVPVHSPAIGSNGIVYIGAGNNLYVVNPDGTLRWEYKTGDYISSPTLDSEDTVYVGSGDGYLYAIVSSSHSLENSPWPMFQHDIRNTGCK